MDDDKDVEVHQGVKDSIHNPSNNRYSTLSDESHETPQMETMEVNERIDPASMRPVKDNKITMNGLTYTAPPIEDFPTPQVTSPVTRGLATNLTENFDNIPGIKLWVRPWGAYFSTDLQTTRSTIAKTLTDFLCRDKLVDLLQPDIEKKERLDPGGAPWHFLVINLTQDEYDIAIKTKVIASKHATLFILPYTQPIPNFVMLLKNITYDEDQVTAGIERVEKAIRDALISTPTLDCDLMELVEDLVVQIRVLSYLLVVYRVFSGRAWDRQTGNDLSTIEWNRPRPVTEVTTGTVNQQEIKLEAKPSTLSLRGDV
ncbi:hypothetical protein AGABI2DRAFT_120569 [Agaricus bisporus var. bisporus H97]|uniref:hypothetical protein n=1 Tax=Agaricus bisporus var. bisporus (strain H97 / ATCC MYA-4626 / FGSC 10389) TaxID=936046 RepID=UPI00029F7A80|nr:hypothetical protein AGABI2DRAFT_120569 [Agaricus bisporus var. bisporus H97]EKV44439.1 hypothetical protein AGABI2DRAFT_120569 [Agaricus bisporus var. bisporus H97]